MPLKILVVDDDPAMLRLYSRIFSGQAYLITLAGSFAAAAILIKADRYALLITDLMLGDGLGTDLAQLFAKESPGGKSLLVSGSLLAAGDLDFSAVSECLCKPLAVDSLMQAVSKALGNPREADCGVLT
jgi:two-component system response regulator PilR (NtrC family)